MFGGPSSRIKVVKLPKSGGVSRHVSFLFPRPFSFHSSQNSLSPPSPSDSSGRRLRRSLPFSSPSPPDPILLLRRSSLPSSSQSLGRILSHDQLQRKWSRGPQPTLFSDQVRGSGDLQGWRRYVPSSSSFVNSSHSHFDPTVRVFVSSFVVPVANKSLGFVFFPCRVHRSLLRPPHRSLSNHLGNPTRQSRSFPPSSRIPSSQRFARPRSGTSFGSFANHRCWGGKEASCWRGCKDGGGWSSGGRGGG